MLSIKKFLSSLLWNQYVLKKSEVKKNFNKKTGLYRYARLELFTSKKDKKGILTRACRTIPIQDGVTYDDAIKISASFKFNLDDDKRLFDKNENKNIKITHLTFEGNEENNTHTGGQIWEFEDGICIEEIITFTYRSS